MILEVNESFELADVVDDSQLSLSYSPANISVKGSLNVDALIKDLQSSLVIQIGVDEAGRGPLLGSVVIGGCILPSKYTGELGTESSLDLTSTPFAKLNDSKKISEKKRNEIYQSIQQYALGFVYVDMPAQIIDEINILQASLQGMRLAVRILLQKISQQINSLANLDHIKLELLFDGNKLPQIDNSLYEQWGYDLNNTTVTAVVKGDSKYTSIASASIVAKVERDKQMYMMARLHPEYGIEKHKGYPTKEHLHALEKFGILNQHRRSFSPVKKIIES